MPALRKVKSLAKCSKEGGQGDIHVVEDGAIVWEGDTIVWVGKDDEFPSKYSGEKVLASGCGLVLPGLIDCHTHLAFGGWRDEEFKRRLKGESYEEIARSGGGIQSTVRATREISEGDLLERASAFLRKMLTLGVTTVEAKSGYGLDKETELKILNVYRTLSREENRAEKTTLVATFLGAHSFPKEISRGDYIKFLKEEMIPLVAKEKLAKFCDVFCEGVAYSRAESKEILAAAKACGLSLKIHADQLTDCGGGSLAAEVGALSADHLEYVSGESLSRMSKAGTIGVLLPLASLYLKKPFVDAKRLISSGVKVAVATDFNPGTAPSFDLPLALRLSVLECGLMPEEAIKAGTFYAASALGLENERGSLDPGKKADIVVLDADSPLHWIYHHSPEAPAMIIKNGDSI